jgi:hypothetical protein
MNEYPIPRDEKRKITNHPRYTNKQPIPYKNHSLNTMEMNQKKQTTEQSTEKKKQVPLYVISREGLYTTKLFKKLNTDTAYRTKISAESKCKQQNSKTVVYQLKCPNCTQKYTRQTGKQFKIRYKEHLLAIKNNKSPQRSLNTY